MSKPQLYFSTNNPNVQHIICQKDLIKENIDSFPHEAICYTLPIGWIQRGKTVRL